MASLILFSPLMGEKEGVILRQAMLGTPSQSSPVEGEDANARANLPLLLLLFSHALRPFNAS
jgi:hypothetical protein